MLSEFRRSEEGDEGPVYSVGLKFVDMLTPRIQALLSFIDEHKIIDEKRLGGLRLHIDAPGKATLDTPEGYRVLVMSRSGMLIETDHGMELDGVCAMELILPAGPPMLFQGRVATHKERQEDDGPRREIGIEFLSLGRDDQERLVAYLETL